MEMITTIMTNYELIYIAFGYEYLLMAAHSATTAINNNQGINCTLITNINIDSRKIKDVSPFNKVIFIDKSSNLNREIKTNVTKYASADYCAYIDCDTEILGSLEPIFKCLKVFDFAMKLNAKPTPKIYEIAPGIPYNLFSSWNGGVIFFRNNKKAQEFFKKWAELYKREGKTHDQPTLARAVFETPGLKLLTLNNFWNTLPIDLRILRSRSKDSRIWHYRNPNEWPKVAPAILQMHENFSVALIDPSTSLLQEVAIVEQRYKLLSSTFYHYCVKHPSLVKFFKNYVRALAKLGLIRQKVKLSRDEHIYGDKYETIK